MKQAHKGMRNKILIFFGPIAFYGHWTTKHLGHYLYVPLLTVTKMSIF